MRELVIASNARLRAQREKQLQEMQREEDRMKELEELEHSIRRLSSDEDNVPSLAASNNRKSSVAHKIDSYPLLRQSSDMNMIGGGKQDMYQRIPQLDSIRRQDSMGRKYSEGILRNYSNDNSSRKYSIDLRAKRSNVNTTIRKMSITELQRCLSQQLPIEEEGVVSKEHSGDDADIKPQASVDSASSDESSYLEDDSLSKSVTTATTTTNYDSNSNDKKKIKSNKDNTNSNKSDNTDNKDESNNNNNNNKRMEVQDRRTQPSALSAISSGAVTNSVKLKAAVDNNSSSGTTGNAYNRPRVIATAESTMSDLTKPDDINRDNSTDERKLDWQKLPLMVNMDLALDAYVKTYVNDNTA